MDLIYTPKELKNFCKTGVPCDSKSSAWKRLFETLRKKWDQVPTGASASEKTTNLITPSDEALLAEWEKARRDITTGTEFTHRGWCYALYADGMRGKNVMDIGSRFGVDTGQGRPPDLVLLASGGVVLVMLFGGLIYFNKMESTIADVV